MFRSWFRRVSRPASATPQPRKKTTIRPSILALEDRCVPATLYVDVTPGSDADGDVFTPVDGAEQTGLTLGDDLFTSVAAAVAVANPGDEIRIAYDPDFEYEIDETIVIDQSLSFVGVGEDRPILVNFSDRIFSVLGSDTDPVVVSFTNLEFHGNFEGAGGGIDIEGGFDFDPEVSIDDCLFAGNGGENGGALAIGAGVVDIQNSTFLDNIASGDGGALFISGGDVTLTNVVIGGDGAGNSAVNGGGIAISGGSLQTVDAIISHNQAASSGGGIHQNGGTVSLDPTIIELNVAVGDGGGVAVLAGDFTMSAGDEVRLNTSTGGNGGGIFFNSAGNLQITGGVLSGNKANNTDNVASKGVGGGLFLASSGANTFLDGASLKDNEADFGAGLAIVGGSLDFRTTPSTVEDNTADTDGGGIHVAGGTLTFTVAGVEIRDNTATNGSGGGLYYTGGGAYTIASATIAGNSADAGSGGGIFVHNANLTLEDGAVGGLLATDGNSASTGGGIAIAAGSLDFQTTASTIQNNTANVAGGGIHVAGGTLTFTVAGNVVRDNTATNGSGGGLYYTGGGAYTIASATIAGNSADAGSGGGIFVHNADLTLSGVAIGGAATADGNSAATGGGLAILNGMADVSTSTFSFNSATSGGGVAVLGGNLALENVTIAENTAATNAAGLLVDAAAAAVTLQSVTIAFNDATGSSGGIRLVDGSLTVENTISALNTGAGTNVDVVGGTFIDNGHNLLDHGTPLLGPLGDYTGGTLTVPLLPDSPALDAGASPPAAGTDQRGITIKNGVRDIGAFESHGFVLVDDTPAPVGDPWQTLVGNVFERDSDPQVNPVPGAPVELKVKVTNAAGGAAANEPVAGGRVRFSVVPIDVGTDATITNAVATIVGDTATSGPITANDVYGRFDIIAQSRNAADLAPPYEFETLGVDSIDVNDPADVCSGDAFAPLIVTLYDQHGNVLKLGNKPIMVTLASANFEAGPNPVFVAAPVDDSGLDGLGNGTGVYTFAGVTIITCGDHTLTFTVQSNKATKENVSDATTIRVGASRLIMSNLPDKVRSGRAIPDFTVEAVGEDGRRDINFDKIVTLAENGPGGFYNDPGAITDPVVPKPAVMGLVTFSKVGLDRGGNYTITASATNICGDLISDSDTIRVTASQIVVTKATSKFVSGGLRSTNAKSTKADPHDANKDYLTVVVVGRDVLNLPADIDSTVKLSIVGGAKFAGATSKAISGPTGTFTKLTVLRSGSFQVKATSNFSGTTVTASRSFQVYGRRIQFVTAPLFVRRQVTVVAKIVDADGKLAKNFIPNDKMILTIRDVGNLAFSRTFTQTVVGITTTFKNLNLGRTFNALYQVTDRYKSQGPFYIGSQTTAKSEFFLLTGGNRRRPVFVGNSVFLDFTGKR